MTDLITFSLFSHVSIIQSTPDTNVVLLLSHLRRDANADLVEPLVTAAVTLDPVHLREGARLSAWPVKHNIYILFVAVTNFGFTSCLFPAFAELY